jgi:hypothetical protein
VGQPAAYVPAQLGRYQVLRHLATGGMAEVLLASVPDHDGRPYHVVVKRIHGERARDERFVRMFLDEASLAAVLQHPNIVRVFEIGEQQGEYFFAMEYVHGEDLRRVLLEVNRQHDKLPLAQVLAITSAVALGLHYAHEARGADGQPLGLVHRDVSPANILVGYDGSVKVADFGIAKATLHSAETRSGTLKGKVSYLSPEQVTGRAIDRRSDVFALGIVLYEIVTARRLFKGDNDFLTMSSIVQGDIPKPSLHRPDLPKPLEDIIMKALATEPDKRYSTADDLRLALERFMNSTGLRTTASGIADYMKKLFAARPMPWLVDGPTIVTEAVDFDSSVVGVVAPPEAAVSRFALPRRIGPTAPIVFAHNAATGQTYEPPPERNDRAQTAAMDAVSLDDLDFTGQHAARSPWLLRGAIAAAALAVLTVVVIALGHGSGSGSSKAATPKAADHKPPPAATEPAPAPAAAEPAVAADPPAPNEAAPADPTPTEPSPPPTEAARPPTTPAHVTKPPAKKPIAHKRPAKSDKGKWDPNALFPE